MPTEKECILCKDKALYEHVGPLNQKIFYNCPNCGQFYVSEVFDDYDIDVHNNIAKHLLSGYIREMNDSGHRDIMITSENFKIMLESPLIPHSPMEKLEKLLLWYFIQTSYFGEFIKLNIKPSICYAVNVSELESYYRLIIDKYLIRFIKGGQLMNGTQQVYLSFEGHRMCKEINVKVDISSSRAFVALWFNDEMNSVYNNAIKPAIESEECGKFKAFRVDNHEHNNDITDEIIAGIKKSRFIIVDLTGYRGGVYYEAGFAKGLGKPVILTCRKDWFDGQLDDNGRIIKEKVHFDINHLNIIVWENELDLKNRLELRIKATIL